MNTYAETVPNTSIQDPRNAFQIGVDRILVRTITHPSAPAQATTNAAHVPERRRLPRGISAQLRETWGCLLIELSDLDYYITGSGEGAGSDVPRQLRAASRGWLSVQSGISPEGFRQEVQIALASTRIEAERIAAALASHTAHVDRIGTAVIGWRRQPSLKAKAPIVNCLPVAYP